MYIRRPLLLLLLISICGAPVAAQSSPENNPVPQFLPRRPLGEQAGIRVDRFQLSPHREGINPWRIIPPPEFRASIPTSDAACYSIRTYRVTRDDPGSDLTRPAGYSICQPAARFDLKAAQDSSARASFP